jgi:type IV secretion system protein VirB6
MAATDSLLFPFTTIDTIYKGAFDLYLALTVGTVEKAVVAPLLVCVTLWLIVQGILIMRGDIDARKGLTKIVSVSLVVGLVTSGSLYQEYVENLFEVAIPSMVTQLGHDMTLPTVLVPEGLDVVFRAGQAGFQKVAMEIPAMDETDALAFEGAQFFFYFFLWGIFGIYDIVGILTSVLVDLGPLFIIGFLFDATRDITNKWIGQLVSYAVLLLLTSIVATIVVFVLGGTMAVFFAATLDEPTSAQLTGLYELDLFIMTGNALVVALPAIAAALGNGVAAAGAQMGQSIFRQFADHRDKEGAMVKASQTTIRDMSLLQ